MEKQNRRKNLTLKIVLSVLLLFMCIIGSLAFYAKSLNPKDITLAVLNGKKIDANAYFPRNVEEAGSIWAEYVDHTRTLRLTGQGTLSKQKFYSIVRDLYNDGKINLNNPWTCEFVDRIAFPENSVWLFVLTTDGSIGYNDPGNTFNENNNINIFRQADIIFRQGVDTSNVNNMAGMFLGCERANPDTRGWNTSRVTKMSHMFCQAYNATPDTSSWDVSQVIDMRHMFRQAYKANPDTSRWNTSRVTNMMAMFKNASVATPDTSNWDVSQVKDMWSMFYLAEKANPDTTRWNTSNVTNLSEAFSRSGYTGDVSNFDFSKLKYAGEMLNNSQTTRVNFSNMRNHYDQIVSFKYEDSATAPVFGNSKIIEEIRAPKALYDRTLFLFGESNYAFFKEDGTTFATPRSAFHGGNTQEQKHLLAGVPDNDIIVIRPYETPNIETTEYRTYKDPRETIDHEQLKRCLPNLPDGANIRVNNEGITKEDKSGKIPVIVTLSNGQEIDVNVPYVILDWSDSITVSDTNVKLNGKVTAEQLKQAVNVSKANSNLGYDLEITPIDFENIKTDTFGVKTAKVKVTNPRTNEFKEIEVKVLVSSSNVVVKFDGGPANTTTNIVAKKNGIVVQKLSATNKGTTNILNFTNLVSNTDPEQVDIVFEPETQLPNYNLKVEKNPNPVLIFKYVPEKITLEFKTRDFGPMFQNRNEVSIYYSRDGIEIEEPVKLNGYETSIVVDKTDKNGKEYDYKYFVATPFISGSYVQCTRVEKQKDKIIFYLELKYDGYFKAHHYTIDIIGGGNENEILTIVWILEEGFEKVSTAIKHHELTISIPQYNRYGEQLGIRYWLPENYRFVSYPDETQENIKLVIEYVSPVKDIHIDTEFFNGQTQIPEQFSVKLLRNGESISPEYDNIILKKAEGFRKTLPDLPIKNIDAEDYNYTLVVNDLPNYISQVENSFPNFKIKNTYKSPDTTKRFTIEFVNGAEDVAANVSLMANNKSAGKDNVKVQATKEKRKFFVDFADIPKTDEKGNDITYTLSVLDLGPNYKIVNSGDTVTISYVVPKKLIDIQKQWVNGDKVRPDQITGKIYRKIKGQPDSTKEFVQDIKIAKTDKLSNNENIWQKSFQVDQTDINAKEYEYSVVENPVPGFNTQYPGPLKIVNEYVPGNRKITVAVEFNGGLGKESVLATLDGNGSKTSLPVQKGSSTVFTVPDHTLKGDKINYSLSMEELSDYTTSIQNNSSEDNLVYTVTYNYQIPKTSYEGKVEYIGGTKPNIQVVLVQNGKVLEDKIATLTKEQFVNSNKKDVIFDNIPKTNENGEIYTYTLQLKQVPENYKTTFENGVLKVIYTTPNEQIPVHINWEKGLQKRVPVDLEVVKVVNGKQEVVDVVNVNAQNKYQGLSKELPKTDENGQKIEYFVRAKTIPKDFVLVENPNDKTGITLKYVIPKYSFTATKIWENGPNTKPEVVLELLANSKSTGKEYRLTNGVVTCKFDGIDKTDENGTDIVYSVKEKTQLEDYAVEYLGNNKVKNTYVIKNITLTKKIIVEGGPGVDKITLELIKDKTPVETKVVLKEQFGDVPFTNIPKTDKNGNDINYVVIVKDIPENYTVKQLPDGNISLVYTSPKIGITVTKKWVGGDVKIPDSIEFELLRNDEVLGKYTITKDKNWQLDIPNLLKTDKLGVDYVYTVKETSKVEDFEAKEDGLEITNTYVIPQTQIQGQVIIDGGPWKHNPPQTIPVVVTDPNGKEYTIEVPTNGKNIIDYTIEVPKTDDKGNDVEYKITVKIDNKDYEPIQEKTNVKLIYTSPKEARSFAFEYVNGQAQRKDLQVNIMRNGQVVGKTITIPKESFKENTPYVLTVENLDAYDNDGKEYTYIAKVANTPELANFVISDSTYSQDNKELQKIVLTYQIPNIILEGMIKFDPSLGKRPSATLIIKQDGKEFKTVQIEDGMYQQQVPKTDINGNEYIYTVDLELEKGTPYKVEWDETKDESDPSIVQKDFNIVYVSPKETLKIQTNFVGLRGLRPQTTINIYQDGKLFKTIKTDKEITEVEVDKTDPNKKEYIYTLSQEPLAGYDTQVNGMVITNVLKPKDSGVGIIPVAGLTRNVPLMIFTMSVVAYFVYSGIKYIKVKRQIANKK